MQLPLLDGPLPRSESGPRGEEPAAALASPFAGLLGELGVPVPEVEPSSLAAPDGALGLADAAQAATSPQLPLWPGWINAAEPAASGGQPAAGQLAATGFEGAVLQADLTALPLKLRGKFSGLELPARQLALGESAVLGPAGSAAVTTATPVSALQPALVQATLAGLDVAVLAEPAQLPELRVVADLDGLPAALPVAPSPVPGGLREAGPVFVAVPAGVPPGGDPGPISAAALPNQVVATLRQFGNHHGEATLQLHPAELGQLELELKQSGTHLELAVSVDNEQSRRLVQEQLSQWRERLAEVGMQLDRLEVSVRDQSSRQDNDGKPDHATGMPEADVNNPAVSLVLSPAQGLDLYA